MGFNSGFKGLKRRASVEKKTFLEELGILIPNTF
jgi:hypothetical protein